QLVLLELGEIETEPKLCLRRPQRGTGGDGAGFEIDSDLLPLLFRRGDNLELNRVVRRKSTPGDMIPHGGGLKLLDDGFARHRLPRSAIARVIGSGAAAMDHAADC